MRWITKYCLICISLLGIFSTECYSKEGIFLYPDSLMAHENWRDARIELEKIIFMHNNSLIKTQAIIQKAICYKNEHDFENTAASLNRVYLFGQPDSIVFQVKYEKALAYYLSKEAGKAIFELQSLQTIRRANEEYARIMFLSSLSYLELQQWEQSKTSTLAFINTIVFDSLLNKSFHFRLNNLFSKKNIPRQLSEKKAQNLSRFIPGGGHFYAGKIGEGMVSFSLHAGLLFFGIDQFYNKFYFTGYTAGFGLLQRLYTGNLQRVQNLVAEVNKENNDLFYKELFQLLSDVSSHGLAISLKVN